MADFFAIASKAQTVAFDTLSRAAVYVNPRDGFSCRVPVLLNTGVEIRDAFGTVVDTRIEIKMLRRDVKDPQRGDRIETDSRSFLLLEPLAEDEISSKWAAALHNG